MRSQRRFYQPKKKPAVSSKEPFEIDIERLSHDGRGLARSQGKTLFVSGALPGEKVKAQHLQQRSKFDEARTLEILNPSPLRSEPRCRHFQQCGGCELQHLESAAQIELKQQQALDQLQRISNLAPEQILSPLDDQHWHYRRRARLSVYCPKKHSEPTLGFRRRQSKQLVAINECAILEEQAEQLIAPLQLWLKQAHKPQALSHIEIARGADETALIVRHTLRLAEQDLSALQQLCEQEQVLLFLQPQGSESLAPYGHEQQRLHYPLVGHDLELAYHPNDFTQINAGLNIKMVDLALQLLDPNPQDRVLDLFSGLGNFTLPIARKTQEVVGIEGSDAMVTRGEENAQRNGIENARFFKADLTREFHRQPWFDKGFNKILLDPPRAGALEVVRNLAGHDAERIVYISCDPATFARDAGELAKQGYRLSQWGVMNMFPQTTHVESIGLFIR
ncbi:MAG: 23S rRNA (uracil(1939)-C(5))-methyltransferase RlmD [Motiliproteus sp.]|nr:23S rRNA (uracil(1939)-C(5))-methyltransferase RlmD [Motiliproteus sp.]